MPESRPLTILCVSSYEKGQEFLRTCKSIGCRVLLLTVEKLRNADWPRESIDEIFFMPEELPVQDLINAVSFAARAQPIDPSSPWTNSTWKTSRPSVNTCIPGMG
jgi:hypothetical protein